MIHFVNLSKNEFSSKIAGRQFLHYTFRAEEKPVKGEVLLCEKLLKDGETERVSSRVIDNTCLIGPLYQAQVQ